LPVPLGGLVHATEMSKMSCAFADAVKKCVGEPSY